MLKACISLGERISPAPAGHISPAPAGHISPAPAGHISLAPAGHISLAPAGHISLALAGHISPAPAAHISPAPAERTSLAPAGHISLAPAGHISLALAGHISLALAGHISLALAERTSPAPAGHIRPPVRRCWSQNAARFYITSASATFACKRNIEMTPLCKIEVTHPRVLGSGEVRRGGGARRVPLWGYATPMLVRDRLTAREIRRLRLPASAAR